MFIVKSRYRRTDSVTAMLFEAFEEKKYVNSSTRQNWVGLFYPKGARTPDSFSFYKIINNLAHVGLPHEHVLTKSYEGTRKKNKFRHIAVNTSQYRQSFPPKTVGPWNQLSFADSPTLENFRINLLSTSRA